MDMEDRGTSETRTRVIEIVQILAIIAQIVAISYTVSTFNLQQTQYDELQRPFVFLDHYAVDNSNAVSSFDLYFRNSGDVPAAASMAQLAFVVNDTAFPSQYQNVTFYVYPESEFRNFRIPIEIPAEFVSQVNSQGFIDIQYRIEYWRVSEFPTGEVPPRLPPVQEKAPYIYEEQIRIRAAGGRYDSNIIAAT